MIITMRMMTGIVMGRRMRMRVRVIEVLIPSLVMMMI
jgi:hypothetical protein